MPTKRGYLSDYRGLFVAKLARDMSAATRRLCDIYGLLIAKPAREIARGGSPPVNCPSGLPDCPWSEVAVLLCRQKYQKRPLNVV